VEEKINLKQEGGEYKVSCRLKFFNFNFLDMLLQGYRARDQIGKRH
jgi:hypothetical protein